MASITIKTPVGPFTIVARDETVLAAGFTDDVNALLVQVPPDVDADLDRPVKAVRAYFDGDLAAIDGIAVEQRGGPFLCNDGYCSRYRPSARHGCSPDTGMSHVGFRCVTTKELWEQRSK